MSTVDNSWKDIVEAYQDRLAKGLDVKAMLKLAQEIEKSPYAHGLHVWTSMDDMCLVKSPVLHPYSGPYIRISPLFNGKAEFSYVNTGYADQQWKREIKEEVLYVCLEKIFNNLGWFAPRD